MKRPALVVTGAIEWLIAVGVLSTGVSGPSA